MLNAVLGALAADPLVKGVLLGGSRARGQDDEFSDIDLVLDAPGWEPTRLRGLWLGGQKARLGDSPFYHGVLADGTVLDVIVGPSGPGYHKVEAEPVPPPPSVELAEGPALDFWLNSLKHAKPFARGLAGMVRFGMHHDAMALVRLWVMEDTGKDPGTGAFTIFGMTPLVRDHLSADRLRTIGLPGRDEAELRAAVIALRDAAGVAGRAAERRWGIPYAHRLEEVVLRRWPL